MEDENKKRSRAFYHVALKALFRKGDEFLFLTDAVGKHFDFLIR